MGKRSSLSLGNEIPSPEFPPPAPSTVHIFCAQFTHMVLNVHLLSLGAVCKTMRNFSL